jgi:hypothetical protein
MVDWLETRSKWVFTKFCIFPFIVISLNFQKYKLLEKFDMSKHNLITSECGKVLWYRWRESCRPKVKIIQLCFKGCSTHQSCVTHNISLYKISKVCIIGTWDFLLFCVCVCVCVCVVLVVLGLRLIFGWYEASTLVPWPIRH